MWLPRDPAFRGIAAPAILRSMVTTLQICILGRP